MTKDEYKDLATNFADCLIWLENPEFKEAPVRIPEGFAKAKFLRVQAEAQKFLDELPPPTMHVGGVKFRK